MPDNRGGEGWPCAAIDKLLEHVDEHKGPESLWLEKPHTRALDQMVRILKDNFQMHLDNGQVNNQINYVWRYFRKSVYKNGGIPILFMEGRGVLNDFCDHEFLQLRGQRENERGFKSDFAKELMKSFGLSRTAGSEGKGPAAIGTPRKSRGRPKKQVSRARQRGTSLVDGRRDSRRRKTPGSVGNIASDHAPAPRAHKKAKLSTILVQQNCQGKKESSPAATSDDMSASAQTQTLTDGDTESVKFVHHGNSASFSAELRASESNGRGRKKPDLVSSPVAPSYSPATPSPSASALDSTDRLPITGGRPQSKRAPSSSTLMGELEAAPVKELRIEKSLQKVSDFITDDPEQYMPSHSDLKDLADSIQNSITTAVYDDLLRGTSTEPCDSPQLTAHMFKPQFLQLCKRIYGGNTPDAVIERASLIHPLRLGQLLSSIVAAAAYDWILQGQHVSLPPAFPLKTEYVKLMEDIIYDVSPEFLDRINRKMKYDWVQTPRRNPQQLENYSHNLSHCLIDVMRPFLRENLKRSGPSDLEPFRERLGEMFSKALRLEMERSLQAEELSFQWVLANRDFDPKFMKAEEIRSITHGSKVQLCLSPALMETKKTQSTSEGPKETVIYRALVSLQR